MVTQAALDRNLSQFEKALNVAGYIPIVSSVSGAVRVLYGKIEVVAAVGTAAISALKALFSDARGSKEWFGRSVMALDYALHGVANIVRGYIEMVPFLGLALCLPYDHCLEERVTYPTERRVPHFA